MVETLRVLFSGNFSLALALDSRPASMDTVKNATVTGYTLGVTEKLNSKLDGFPTGLNVKPASSTTVPAIISMSGTTSKVGTFPSNSPVKSANVSDPTEHVNPLT